MAVDPRHHGIRDHAIDPATARLLQRAQAYLKKLDRFFAVRRKVIVPDTQRLHHDAQHAAHKLIVLYQQAGHSAEIITHGRSHYVRRIRARSLRHSPLGSHQPDIRGNFESNEDIEIVTRRYVRTRPVDVCREQLRQSIDGRFDIIGIDEITMPARTPRYDDRADTVFARSRLPDSADGGSGWWNAGSFGRHMRE